MDIKEIALKVADSLRNKVDGISHMQSNQGLARFAEALISAYKAELLKEVGEPVAYMTTDEEGSASMLFFDRAEALKYSGDDEPVKLFTESQLAAAQEEIDRLKGEKNVQLDIYPNNAGTKQQREVDGSLEMGQLLADSKNEETSNPETEGKFALKDTFRGDLDLLIASAKALVELDTEGCLVPHGIGNHANGLLSSLCVRIDELRQQLKAAQEEWNQCSGLLDDAHRSIEMLEDQLATAEQRVAEACAELQFERSVDRHGYDKYEDADAIRSGEWRKFLKEGE